MRIAVAGGTGTIGRHVVEAVAAAGHESIVLSRSHGVDLVRGTGLDSALAGADAVIDTVNLSSLSADESSRFFTATSNALTSAVTRLGVKHLVVLSIVGIDRIPHDYYAGKLAQERAVEASDAPFTILRATQFHEFAAQMFAQAKLGPLHVAPKARVQPIAAREVAHRLVELAASPAQGRAQDVAGPREEALDHMVRRYARAIGYRGWVPALAVPGAQMAGMRKGLALPDREARLGTQTFDEWLANAHGKDGQ